MRATMFKSLVVLICVTCASVSHASDGKNILLGIIGAAMKKSQERAQQEAANAQLPPGMMPTEASAQSDQLPEWPTKAAFIEAVKRGELSRLYSFQESQSDVVLKPVADSVAYMLAMEYQTPIPNDIDCKRNALREVTEVLVLITEIHMGTLSDRAPNFMGVGDPIAVDQLQQLRSSLGTGNGYCSLSARGASRPHPYGKSLLSLANEYGEATKYFVEQERARRAAAYEEQLRQQRLAKQRIEEEYERSAAAARAAEQKRIKAEREKVEVEERKRQQVQRSRISG